MMTTNKINHIRATRRQAHRTLGRNKKVQSSMTGKCALHTPKNSTKMDPKMEQEWVCHWIYMSSQTTKVPSKGELCPWRLGDERGWLIPMGRVCPGERQKWQHATNCHGGDKQGWLTSWKWACPGERQKWQHTTNCYVGDKQGWLTSWKWACPGKRQKWQNNTKWDGRRHIMAVSSIKRKRGELSSTSWSRGRFTAVLWQSDS